MRSKDDDKEAKPAPKVEPKVEEPEEETDSAIDSEDSCLRSNQSSSSFEEEPPEEESEEDCGIDEGETEEIEEESSREVGSLVNKSTARVNGLLMRLIKPDPQDCPNHINRVIQGYPIKGCLKMDNISCHFYIEKLKNLKINWLS